MPAKPSIGTILKTALNNNRSRVAIVLAAPIYAFVYSLLVTIGLPDDVAKQAADFSTGSVIAYILGNGYYEAHSLLVGATPPPPKK